MTDQFHKHLENELSQRRAQNLYRQIPLFSNCRLNLSTNDYFWLRQNPAVKIGAHKALETYGTGSGASPLLSGFLPCHEHLLNQLLKWKKKPFGMMFNAGFMANQAVVRHLPGKDDLVLVDRLIHHSIAQALLQGPAKFKRYDHLDMLHLEELIEKNHTRFNTIFVFTESVFSMDGDYPDLQHLVRIKKKILLSLSWTKLMEQESMAIQEPDSQRKRVFPMKSILL